MEKSLPLEKVIHIIKPQSASVLNLYMYKFESDFDVFLAAEGKRVVKPSKVTKEMETDKVCLFNLLTFCLFV